MGDDERLLTALGEAAREGDPLADPRWEALSAGKLSPADEAALPAPASEAARGEDLRAPFRPLGSEAEDRIVQRLLGMPESGAPGESKPAAPPLLAAVKGGAGEAPGEQPTKARPTRRRARALYAAMAAAAAVILWLSFRPPESLPGYAMDVAGGERVVRSAEGPPREIERFGPGSRLEITIRAAEPVRGPVEARAFLVRDGRARVLAAPVEVAAGGAVRIAGETDVVLAGVAPGRWELVVAVGRPGTLPGEAAIVAHGAPERAPFRLLSREILVGEPNGTPNP